MRPNDVLLRALSTTQVAHLAVAFEQARLADVWARGFGNLGLALDGALELRAMGAQPVGRGTW